MRYREREIVYNLPNPSWRYQPAAGHENGAINSPITLSRFEGVRNTVTKVEFVQRPTGCDDDELLKKGEEAASSDHQQNLPAGRCNSFNNCAQSSTI